MLKSLIKLHMDSFDRIMLNKGDILLFENSNSPLLYFLIEGIMQIGRLNFQNSILTQGIVKNNTCFIVQSNSGYVYQGKALETSYILVLTFESLDNIIKSNPLFLTYIVNGIYQYFIQLEEFSSIFFPKTVYNRTIALLLYLAKYFGYHSFKGTEIQVSITQANIAQILGSSRVTITRIFKILYRTQCLEVYYNRLFTSTSFYICILIII